MSSQQSQGVTMMSTADMLQFGGNDNTDVYFKTLSSLTNHARTLQIKDEEGERRLLEFLPVNERMSMAKEQKVLARWQERQRDWERIENALSKKITAKLMTHRINKSATGRPLMMTTTDEYRAKLEEYDLIQASIPLEDKFTENWVMSLRGGGPIHVPIGHVFSGLECEVDPVQQPPKIVRKPKPAENVAKNDTFLEQTENLVKKQRKYKKNMQALRPHTLTYQDAGNLVVRAQNLFEWAQQSSEEYLEQEKEFFLNTMKEQQAEQMRLEADERRKEEELEKERQMLLQNKGPKLQLLSPTELLMVALPGQTAKSVFSMHNSGTTALYFRWTRLVSKAGGGQSNGKSSSGNNASATPGAPSADSLSSSIANIDESLVQVLDAKGRSESALLARTLRSERTSFYVLQDRGEILPGETLDVVFHFDNRNASEGVFEEQWLLECTPDDARILLSEASANSSSNQGNNKNAVPLMGCVKINCHGHTLTVDDTRSRRDAITHQVQQDVLYTAMQDILLDCVRKVRTPLKQDEVDRRIVAYFHVVNAKMFEQLFNSPQDSAVRNSQYLRLCSAGEPFDNSEVYSTQVDVERRNRDSNKNGVPKMMCPLFVTLQRILELERLHEHAQSLSKTILDRYEAVIENAEKSSEKIAVEIDLDLPEFKRNHALKVLFPESILECFDEVSMNSIEPRWAFDVSLTVNALNSLRPVVAHIEQLEEFIAARDKELQRQKARAERIAQRKANGDSDDEDEEEEEEEIDEEEERLKRIGKKHDLLHRLDAVFADLFGKLNQLAMHPLSLHKIEQVVKRELEGAIDNVCSCADKALQEANLSQVFVSFQQANGGSDAPLSGLIAPLPSPFANADGEEAWKRILAIESPAAALQAEQQALLGDKKNAKAPAKNAPAVTTATPVQCDVFHKVLYDNIREELLSCMERVMDSSMTGIQTEIEKTFHGYSQIRIPEALAVSRLDSVHVETGGNGELTAPVETQLASEKPQHAETLSRLSTYSAGQVENSVVFYAMSAQYIVSPPASAFDVRTKCLQELADELLPLYVANAKCVTLVYDGRDSDLDKNHSLESHVFDIQTALQTAIDAHIVEDQRQRKKLKLKDPKQYRNIQITYCKNFADLYFRLDQYLRFGNEKTGLSKEDYFQQTLPIFVLENLQCKNVVPAEPQFLDEDSDDDMPAIAVGKELDLQVRRRKFVHSRPFRVNVPVDESVASSSSSRIEMQVYCDLTAAIQELVSLSTNQGDSVLWIDGQADALMRYDCAAFALHEQLSAVRVVSHRVREAVGYCSVLHALRNSSSLPRDDVNPADAQNPLSPNQHAQAITTLNQELSFYFQDTSHSPLSVAVIGGELRMDKFRVVDELLSMVDKIVLGGELALPFVALSYLTSANALFPDMHDRLAQYFAVVRALLVKARLLGTVLQWPRDVQLAEHALSEREISHHRTHLVPDARNETIDCESDVRVISLSALQAQRESEYKAKPQSEKESEVTTEKTIMLPGFVYDCGPESIQSLQQSLEQAQLILVWGTLGVCEVNNFQLSHSALMQSLQSLKPAAVAQMSDESKEVSLSNGPVIMLWGEQTVEWARRLSDSDGEMHGDLVQAGGIVTYMNSDAVLLRGLIGRYPSLPIQERLSYSSTDAGRLLYTLRRPAEQEEDDEEEDEEEEED